MVTLISMSFVLLGACGTGNSADEDTSASSTANTTQTSEAEVVYLSLGMMPATNNIPFIVAHQQGFDVENGVSIDLENFKAAKDRDAAFQAGQVDGVSTDLVAVAMYQEAGFDVKVTGATWGQFDLVAAKDVTEVAQLKGQKVIYARNTGTEFAVEQILETADLTEDDIEITEVAQVPTRLELLQNDQAAAAILPEPFVTMGRMADLNVLSSTLDIGRNPFVLGFSAETIEKKSDAIIGMYKAYDQAIEYIQSHDKKDFIQLFIDEVGFPDNIADEIVVPDYPKAVQTTEEDFNITFAWAKEKGLITKDLTSKDVLSDVYFK